MKMVVDVESQQYLTVQTQNTAQGDRSVSKLLKTGNHSLSTQKSSVYQYRMRGDASATAFIIGLVPKLKLTSLLRQFLDTVLFPICCECL